MKLDELDVEILRVLSESGKSNTGAIAFGCFLNVIEDGDRTIYDTSKKPATQKVRYRLKRLLKVGIVVNVKGYYEGVLHWALSDKDKDIYNKTINL